MSTIGSGPGLGSGGNIEVNTALKVATSDQQSTTVDATATAAQATTVSTDSSNTASSTTSNGVVTSTATAAGTIPQDSDRVAAIKKAIEQGDYPILPTKISDAMIAASMLWRSPK